MNPPILYQLRDGVAVLTLANPPVNAISAAVRTGLAEALARAQADPQAHAVVLAGNGGAFCGGAEVREFNTLQQKQAPILPELNRLQEACTKPLVAAIAGFAYGGGLEVALACHWRVAQRAALLGLPEVKLGLMPGSGGTQRLPRLVPMARALEMMTTGKPVDAETAHRDGLVDRLADGDVVEAAIAFARGVTVRRVSDLPVQADPQAHALLAEARQSLSRKPGCGGALAIVASCEAALELPFEQGLAFERERFLQLLAGPEFKALSHVFFAERESRKVPGLTAAPRSVAGAAVIGAGTMGSGIAICLANAGIPVTLIDSVEAALARGMAAVRTHFDTEFSKGRISQAVLEQRLGLIRPSRDIGDVDAADLVIEAAFERMDVKQEIFRMLDRFSRPGTVLATNTSTLDIDRIAGVTSRPQDVVGLHFFSPAPVMRLLEVVRCEQTSDEVLATALQLGKALGKVAVVSGVCDGFIGNRMLQKYLQQALFLLDEGCSPQQVDAAMEEWGMAMGPFAVGDLAGLDIGWAVRKRRREEGSTMVYSAIADRICEAGRLGQKTGKGWYRYEPGSRKRLADPEVDAILAQHRRDIGVPQREVTAGEIVDRLVLALATEGAAILQEGIALRASDIDITWITGYGFPAFRGGPMFHAGAIGAAAVRARIDGFARGYQGAQWETNRSLQHVFA